MTASILVVDDEPNVRLNYRIALETESYEVFAVDSGERAIQVLAEREISLAILDMRMPGMDGLELLEKVRESGINVPTLIITAYSDVPHAVKAMKLGAIDFLQKPLRPGDLRRLVAEILKRHIPSSESSAQDFSGHIIAAKRCLNLRAFAKAHHHLAKALELNNRSPEAFNLAGLCAEMVDDIDRAKRYYGQAIKLNKNYEPAQQNMRRLFEVFHFGSSKEPVNLGDD
ncbi:MAG: response regulator [Verrucomicrobia bacterium]|nr:response regulator [Verrucomicrobiota bacterium]MBV9671522.1 response regulator [Verrucomicrobiota bacterium]